MEAIKMIVAMLFALIIHLIAGPVDDHINEFDNDSHFQHITSKQ